MKKILKIMLIILAVSFIAACSQEKPIVQESNDDGTTWHPSDPIPSIPIPF